jgi:hypothetical protein
MDFGAHSLGVKYTNRQVRFRVGIGAPPQDETKVEIYSLFLFWTRDDACNSAK